MDIFQFFSIVSTRLTGLMTLALCIFQFFSIVSGDNPGHAGDSSLDLSIFLYCFLYLYDSSTGKYCPISFQFFSIVSALRECRRADNVLPGLSIFLYCFCSGMPGSPPRGSLTLSIFLYCFSGSSLRLLIAMLLLSIFLYCFVWSYEFSFIVREQGFQFFSIVSTYWFKWYLPTIPWAFNFSLLFLKWHGYCWCFIYLTLSIFLYCFGACPHGCPWRCETLSIFLYCFSRGSLAWTLQWKWLSIFLYCFLSRSMGDTTWRGGCFQFFSIVSINTCLRFSWIACTFNFSLLFHVKRNGRECSLRNLLSIFLYCFPI